MQYKAVAVEGGGTISVSNNVITVGDLEYDFMYKVNIIATSAQCPDVETSSTVVPVSLVPPASRCSVLHSGTSEWLD